MDKASVVGDLEIVDELISGSSDSAIVVQAVADVVASNY